MAKTKTLKERHPLYHTWAWMRRMSTKSDMSPEWKKDFYKFVDDMGIRPSPLHRLQRREESQGYSKENCVWREAIPCADSAKYQREYRRKYPERTKGYDLKRRLGLSLDGYNALVQNQNNLCAICHGPETFNGSLSVDHSHDTGKVRGLLCTNCNRGLGHFKDSLLYLKSAIEYLMKHDVTVNTGS